MTRLFAGTVFDSHPTCDRCSKPLEQCSCPPVPVEVVRKPPAKQTAKLSLERRKKGKTVTIIRGLSASDTDLPELLAAVKQACGAGGSLAGEELEVQGDQRSRVREVLSTRGYRVTGDVG